MHNIEGYTPTRTICCPCKPHTLCIYLVLMQEYDYVFDIELDEGSPTMRKLKLPYNRDS